MIVDTVLTDAKAYLKGQIVECSIAIEDGKIEKIGKESNMPSADQRIDLNHHLVLPGIIDSHVHLRDEEKAYKETFLTGTAAAAAGGVTTVLDMPNNSPITASVHALRNRMEIVRRRALVNVGLYAQFPTDPKGIQAIVDAGAVAFKLFMAEPIGLLNIDDDEALADAFQATAKAGVPVAVHAEDHALLKKAMEHFRLMEQDDIGAFLKAHDENVELAAVEHLLNINRKIDGLKLHFCHISTEKALDAVSKVKKDGKTVTCEVTPHHLFLTKDDYERFGAMAVTMPPLRTKENIFALWKGIENGTVDTVGSDHAPHTLEEKAARRIWDVKVGIPGLETMLPLMLTAVHKNILTLTRTIELMAEKPAQVFGLESKGRLEQGKDADLVVIDFNHRYRLDISKFKSEAKFSPFDKWNVQGKPVKTYVNGQLVMDEGDIVAKPGSGSVVRSEPA